ncbi:MAG: glycosyltransferase [bacterium]
MNPNITLSIVIPTYRSEEQIQPLLERVLPILGEIKMRAEVIFVDDGSEPGSVERLRRRLAPDRLLYALPTEPPILRAVLLTRNAGQQQATLCGICHAHGELVVTMDDDLQHRPEDIPRLLEELRAGSAGAAPDLVYGVPAASVVGPLRRLGSRGRDLIFRLAFGKRAAGIRPTSFRAFRRELIAGLCRDPRGFLYLSAEFFRAGARIAQLPVHYDRPPQHPARYPLRKLLKVFAGLGLYIPIFPPFLRLLFGGAKWEVAGLVNFPGTSGDAGTGR